MRRTLAAGLLALATTLHAQDPKPADSLRYLAMLPAAADLPAGRLVKQVQAEGSFFHRELRAGVLEVNAVLTVLPAGQSAVEKQQATIMTLEQEDQAARIGFEFTQKTTADSSRTVIVMLPTGPGRDAIRRATVSRIYAKTGVYRDAQAKLATGRFLAGVSVKGTAPEPQITALLHQVITLMEQRIDSGQPAAAPATRAPTPPPVNVVDYFNLLFEKKVLINGVSITKTPTGWKCFEGIPASDLEFKCVVDIPNGFLQIDFDPGEGTYTLQIALFKTTDSRLIVALNRYGIDVGSRWTNSRAGMPRFYSYGNGTFAEISRTVFPDTVTRAHFGPSPAGTTMNVHYVLPRVGTSIKALPDHAFCFYCAKHLPGLKASLDAKEFADRSKLCEVCHGMTRQEVTLTFDKAAGRFRIQP